MQNPFNLVSRDGEDVLDYCTEHGIGFIPFFPLAAGHLADPGGAVAQIADAHEATPGQVALAWLLAAQPGDAADPRHGFGRAPCATTSPPRACA